MWKTEVDHLNKLIDVIPLGEHHSFGEECWCTPQVEVVNGWIICVHNSEDKREYLVEGKLMSIIN